MDCDEEPSSSTDVVPTTFTVSSSSSSSSPVSSSTSSILPEMSFVEVLVYLKEALTEAVQPTAEATPEEWRGYFRHVVQIIAEGSYGRILVYEAICFEEFERILEWANGNTTLEQRQQENKMFQLQASRVLLEASRLLEMCRSYILPLFVTNEDRFFIAQYFTPDWRLYPDPNGEVHDAISIQYELRIENLVATDDPKLKEILSFCMDTLGKGGASPLFNLFRYFFTDMTEILVDSAEAEAVGVPPEDPDEQVELVYNVRPSLSPEFAERYPSYDVVTKAVAYKMGKYTPSEELLRQLELRTF